MAAHPAGAFFGGDMTIRTLIPAAVAALAFLLPVAMGQPLQAKPAFNEGWRKGRETGLPVPRFVSLKAHTARMRVGPSTDYATSWLYSVRGIPLEITEEYGNWRRVRDQDGVSGWMSAPLLSGRRTAVIGPWLDEPVALRAAPSTKAKIIVRLSPRVRLDIDRCDGKWCEASIQLQRLSGFVKQEALWGVYPQEIIE